MLSAHEAEIVRRDGDLPGLAVLLDTDAFLEVLSQEFPSICGAEAAIQYVRYKPGTSCLCSYRIGSAGGSFDVYAKAFLPRHAEKLRHWRSDAPRGAGGRPHRGASERWHLGISLFPDDRRLKVLGRLHDASTRGRVLAAAFGRHPEWWRSAVATLRYKPERRYVASLIQDGTPVAVLKMYDAFGYGEARARRHVFHARETLRIPVCVGESSPHRLLGFEWVPGRALHEEMARSLAAVELTGVALAELHEQDGRESLPIHDGAAARAVHAAAESVATIYPQLAGRARSLAEGIASELDERARSVRPAHGDFYAEQAIVTGSSVAILDFDRACLAHPAADLGTFAAHLRRAALRGGHSRAHAEAGVQALLQGYSRRRPAPEPAQLAAYTAAALLRLAPEPFRRQEQGRVELTEAILEDAAEALAPGAQDSRPRVAVRPAGNSIIVDDSPDLASEPGWSFLRPALDPSEARRCLEPHLTQLGAVHAQLRGIRVTRHKPGRRCIVEYEFDAGAGSHEQSLVLLGKSRIKGVNANAQLALESLWNAGFNPASGSVCVPQPLGSVPAWRMTLQRKVAGVPAGERLAKREGALVAARIAEAIHALHTRGTPPARHHTVDDELRILRERLSRVDRAAGAGRIERLLDRCERLAARVPRCEPRPIHRDFYPAHVLVEGNRLWLIDFDLYCAGDPSLDAGNFLAHMIEERLRRDGCAEGPSEAESAFESRYAQLAGRRVLPAIRAYTTLSLVRHVHLSTQYPERRHTTPALLELCERRLSVGVESRLHA